MQWAQINAYKKPFALLPSMFNTWFTRTIDIWLLTVVNWWTWNRYFERRLKKKEDEYFVCVCSSWKPLITQYCWRYPLFPYIEGSITYIIRWFKVLHDFFPSDARYIAENARWWLICNMKLNTGYHTWIPSLPSSEATSGEFSVKKTVPTLLGAVEAAAGDGSTVVLTNPADAWLERFPDSCSVPKPQWRCVPRHFLKPPFTVPYRDTCYSAVTLAYNVICDVFLQCSLSFSCVLDITGVPSTPMMGLLNLEICHYDHIYWSMTIVTSKKIFIVCLESAREKKKALKIGQIRFFFRCTVPCLDPYLTAKCHKTAHYQEHLISPWESDLREKKTWNKVIYHNYIVGGFWTNPLSWHNGHSLHATI